jgi:hypothetical protein
MFTTVLCAIEHQDFWQTFGKRRQASSGSIEIVISQRRLFLFSFTKHKMAMFKGSMNTLHQDLIVRDRRDRERKMILLLEPHV